MPLDRDSRHTASDRLGQIARDRDTLNETESTKETHTVPQTDIIWIEARLEMVILDN